MTDAAILPFACGHLYYGLGPTVACSRARWHGGDHRTYTDDGQLIEWPDPPAPPNEEDTTVMAFGDRHTLGSRLQPPYPNGHHPIGSLCQQGDCPELHDPLPLDENTEGVTLEHKPERADGARLVALVRAMAAVLLLVIIACAPAVVIAAWRLLL